MKLASTLTPLLLAFEKEASIWGFPVSRLERFWLRAGAVPLRVLRQDGDPSVIALLREDEALRERERFKKESPTAPSPWFYLSKKGIYDSEISDDLRMQTANNSATKPLRIAA